jgi:hypothetical protein
VAARSLLEALERRTTRNCGFTAPVVGRGSGIMGIPMGSHPKRPRDCPILNFSVADLENGQFGTDSNKPPFARSTWAGVAPARLALPGVSPLAPGFFSVPA